MWKRRLGGQAELCLANREGGHGQEGEGHTWAVAVLGGEGKSGRKMPKRPAAVRVPVWIVGEGGEGGEGARMGRVMMG